MKERDDIMDDRDQQYRQVWQTPQAPSNPSMQPTGVQPQPVLTLEDAKIYKRVFSRLCWALVAMMLVTQLSAVGISALVGAIIPQFAQSPWYMWVVQVISMYILGLGAFYLVVYKIPSFSPAQKSTLSAGQFLGYTVVSFGAMYAFNMITVVIVNGISMLRGQQVTNPLESLAGNNWLVTLLFGAVVAPIIEEFIFRKLLIDKLRPFGDKICIFTTAMLFGLFHGNLSQMFYAFALGVVFAYVTIKTGRVLYAVLLHMIVNAFGMVIMPAVVTTGNMIATAFAGFFVLALIIAGAVVFFLNLRTYRFEKGQIQLPKGRIGGLLFGNSGMIAFLTVCGIFIVLYTLFV